MPLEEITPYISDEMMQGRFGEVIGSYTGERWDFTHPFSFSIKSFNMKKIVLLNTRLYGDLQALNVTSYNDYVAALYNYKKGIDYNS